MMESSVQAARVPDLRRDFVELEVHRVRLRVAALVREGASPAIVLFHGFGSTKEDWADLAAHPGFAHRAILAWDAPGCGETECSDLSVLSIPFLKRAAERLVGHYALSSVHLVGHSMGGLTALLFAEDHSRSVASFTNIEGNLMPEDCFLSRQIVDSTSSDPERFLDELVERTRLAPALSHPLYAAGLRCKVRPGAVAPIFRSMVELSDRGGLLERFLLLSLPRMFVYGASNRSLSYLGALERRGVVLSEIPQSGHFPMYSNPPALWSSLSGFLEDCERGARA